MGSVAPLLTFLLLVILGWVHRRQLILIEFLQAENGLLKERLRGKRIRFTDAERALLARKAKAVGRKALLELDTIVSPDTTPRGLVTHYVLFVINVAERAVHIAGITTRPDEAWMLQVGRNLIDEESGAFASKRDLIIDRDTQYTRQFRRLVEEGGTEIIRLPPMSPNLNAYAERFVRSIKNECLIRMIFIGQASLRRAIGEYMAHYHEERNHQGLENRLIRPAPTHSANTGCTQRHRKLGGMLNYYYLVDNAVRLFSSCGVARAAQK